MTAFYPVWPYLKKKHVPVIYDIMDVHMFVSYMDQHHKVLVPFAKVFTKIIDWRERAFYENISGICALGRNQLMIAKNRTTKTDIPTCLIYNGINVPDFRKRMELPCQVALPEKREGEIWCVYAGSLGPSYDIATLLDCADKVKHHNDRIRFIIAGVGPQASLVKIACKKNSQITYLGVLNPNLLPAIYKRCDIGLCTYASFSTVDMPDKFYDYTAAGVAVVNSLHGEVMEYVKEVGIQYEAGNSESLYDAIQRVCLRLEEYKRASYQLADRFDLNEQMKPLLKMIDNLLR